MILTLIKHFAATGPCGDPPGFFGLKPWYQFIYDNDHFENNDTDGCVVNNFTFFPSSSTNQPSDVPLVMLAVIDDLLRVAGLVAVAFIIVGAIKYITSQGNPESTAKAQSTILNALIGLVIAVTAITFVSFIGNRLGS